MKILREEGKDLLYQDIKALKRKNVWIFFKNTPRDIYVIHRLGGSTDLSRWIIFLYFSYLDCLELLSYKSFRKIFLHSPTHVCWSRTRSCWWSARSIANQADDPTLFSNYRPISILPAFSKLFEKAMYNRLIDFLNLHNIL